MSARRPCRAALSGRRQEIGFTLKSGSAHESIIVYAKPILKLCTRVVPSAIFLSCRHSHSVAIEAGQGTRPTVSPNIKICRTITSRMVKRRRIGYRRLALNKPSWTAATVWPLGLDPHLIGYSGVTVPAFREQSGARWHAVLEHVEACHRLAAVDALAVVMMLVVFMTLYGKLLLSPNPPIASAAILGGIALVLLQLYSSKG